MHSPDCGRRVPTSAFPGNYSSFFWNRATLSEKIATPSPKQRRRLRPEFPEARPLQEDPPHDLQEVPQTG